MYPKEFNLKKMPNDKFLLPYVLLAIHKLGGDCSKKEVVKYLIKYLDLKDDFINKKTPKNKVSYFGMNIAWARLRLEWLGYIYRPKWGFLGLKQEGKDKVKELEESEGESVLDKFSEEAFRESEIERKNRNKRNKKKKRDSKPTVKDDVEEELLEEEREDSKYKKDLEKIIKILNAYQFERLCSKLLREVGYEDVETTKKSGDGGIDGIGYLVFGLVRFKVVFQAKKFADIKVSSKDIDALGGTMQKTGSEKAIFITTSDFTREARKME